MELLTQKLEPEKREQILTLLAKLDSTDDTQLVLDNSILRYAETRLGIGWLKKSRGKKERKPEADNNEAPAENVIIEPAPETPIEVVPVEDLTTENVTESVEPAPEIDIIHDTPVKPTRNNKKSSRKGGRR